MPWFAVHTRSRHEDVACRGLLLKSIHAFLPKMEVWSKRKDRRRKIQVPIFPGYLFVEVEPDNHTRLSVLTTPGVVRMLGKKAGGDPIPVPESQISAVRRVVESRVEMHRIQYPEAGEKAMIIDGPFTGIEGTVLKTDLARELFVISIELLQRAVAIKVEGFQIRKI
ncbi:MAG: UpxY family transcription antiterminator [Syntrophales bacterium]|nr:UpxY family transcription antiterminator [Syntrophales bacterium]